jgi:prostatic aicd phosphatase
MLLASLIVVSVSLATAAAEAVHGIMVVSRHGDRKLSVLISQQLIAHARSGTSKHYSDYTLTNLGYDQAFDAGSFFRETYVVDGAPRKILGISPEAYVTNQLYAAAPDQQVKCHPG